jgi:hypothetical protein
MEYTPRPRPTNESELKAELIRNAAFVAYEGRKAKALSDWVAAVPGRRIVYVYDTDVIVAHCAPWKSGPADDDFLGRGYGQILPLMPLGNRPPDKRVSMKAVERRRAEAVCWLLTNKALQAGLGQRMPILQTKPHFDETLRVYEAVKSNAARDSAVSRSSSEDRRDRVTDQMLRFVSGHLARNTWPLEANPVQFLSAILNGMQNSNIQRASRFVREWDAFLALFRQSSGIFDLTEFSPGAGTFVQPQIDAWNQIRTLIKSDSLAAQTERAIVKEQFSDIILPKHYQLRREQLNDDVSALELVASVNINLQKNGIDSFRVVLITGDRKTVLALAASRKELAGSMYQSISEFSFNHVHHIWSFVDDLATSSFPQESRAELFSGLLAFAEDELSTVPYIDRMIGCAIRAESELFNHIHVEDIDQSYSRWGEYSERASNLHRHYLVDPNRMEKISDILIKKYQQESSRSDTANLDVPKLRSMAIETMARARDRANVQFSEIGANSILEAHSNGIRNPPDLMFDSLKETDRIFKDLALPRRVFTNASDFAVRFEQISEDCYRPDPKNPADDDYRQECYLKYLVLGALFASANRWVVAEQHAESALSIVTRAVELRDPIKTRRAEGRQPANISGREAQFLLAVAKRIRAQDSKAYDLSKQALDRAVACLANDHDAGAASGISSIRFDCEYLALSLARYYYSRSCRPDLPFNDEADDVFRRAAGLINSLTPGPDYVLGRVGELRASTRASIATNILQTAVIARFRQMKGYVGTEVSPVSQRELRIALKILEADTDLKAVIARALQPNPEESLESAAEIICSPLMMLYTIVASLILDDKDTHIHLTHNEIEWLFRVKDPAVTSYDRWRFKMLESLAMSLLRY